MTDTPPTPPTLHDTAPRHVQFPARLAVGAAFVVLLAVAGARAWVTRAEVTSFYDIFALALAAVALVVATTRARGRTRFADAFFPLVLLNPLLLSRAGNTTLLSTALLGLIAAAIIAMRRDNLLRYFAVAILTALLALLSPNFLLIAPPLIAWFLIMGYLLARNPAAKKRADGYIILSLGEAGLLLFGIAVILEQPASPPPPSTLFATIVNFTEFPLVVLAICMLALGWRKGTTGRTPPHFAGMLALLVGLLLLILNNFQSGSLRAPGADQSALILCLLYTVFALHGPRRLQWLIPPALLLAAVGYTVFQ